MWHYIIKPLWSRLFFATSCAFYCCVWGFSFIQMALKENDFINCSEAKHQCHYKPNLNKKRSIWMTMGEIWFQFNGFTIKMQSFLVVNSWFNQCALCVAERCFKLRWSWILSVRSLSLDIIVRKWRKNAILNWWWCWAKCSLLRSRSQATLARFCPPLTTYLPTVNIYEGIPLLLNWKICIQLTYLVPPTYLVWST